MRTAWLRANFSLDYLVSIVFKSVYKENETKNTGKDEARMTKELSRRNQRKDRHSKGR